MAIDKFKGPLVQELTDPKERKAHAESEEITLSQTEAKEVFLFIEEALKKAGETLPKNAKLLEIGTGKGEFLKYLREQGYNIIGVDARPRHELNLPIALARIERLPLENDTFYAAFSTGAFDPDIYLQYKDAMIAEMHRVLKPGGLYIAMFDHGRAKLKGFTRIFGPSQSSVTIYRRD